MRGRIPNGVVETKRIQDVLRDKLNAIGTRTAARHCASRGSADSVPPTVPIWHAPRLQSRGFSPGEPEARLLRHAGREAGGLRPDLWPGRDEDVVGVRFVRPPLALGQRV